MQVFGVAAELRGATVPLVKSAALLFVSRQLAEPEAALRVADVELVSVGGPPSPS